MAVATDGFGSETYTFRADLGSWKTYAGDLARYARAHRLAYACSHQRGPLLGLRGIDVSFTVTGRQADVAAFMDYVWATDQADRPGSAP
jgi:hypothetical protein